MELQLPAFLCSVLGLYLFTVAGAALIGSLTACLHGVRPVAVGIFYGMVLFATSWYIFFANEIPIIAASVFLFALLQYQKVEFPIAALFFAAGMWLSGESVPVTLLIIADVLVIHLICRQKHIAQFLILCTIMPLAFSPNIIMGGAAAYMARVIWFCGIVLQLVLTLVGFYFLLYEKGIGAIYLSQYISLFRDAITGIYCFCYQGRSDRFLFPRSMGKRYGMRDVRLSGKDWSDTLTEFSGGQLQAQKRGIQKGFLSLFSGQSCYVVYGYFPLPHGNGIGFLRETSTEISPEEFLYYRLQKNENTGFLSHKMLPEQLFQRANREHSDYFLAVLELSIQVPGYSIYDVEMEAKSYRLLMHQLATNYSGLEFFSINTQETILLFPFDGHKSTADKLSAQLQNFFEQDFELDGRKMICFARMGFHPVYADQLRSYEDALRCSEELLFCLSMLKHSDRLSSYFFVPEDYETYIEKMRRVRYLHSILSAGKIHLTYQPIVDIDTGRPLLYEVLTRVDHEAYQSIEQFFSDCEEFSLDTEVDTLIIQRLRDALFNREIPFCDYTLNLSGNTRISPTLESIADLLYENGHRLYLEVVERTVCNQKILEERQNFASKHHAALIVDDYGEQYAGLEMLTRVRFSGLKISKLFIEGIDVNEQNQSLVQAVALLAKNVGMMCIAEGIETEGELQVLRQLGIQYAQGYYFARPEPQVVLQEKQECTP